MRIVIVGASGNVGTALLRRLAGEDVELVGIARRPPTDAGPPYDAVEWVADDIGSPGSEARLANAFRGAGAVIHLGWQIQPSHDRALLRRTNVTGSAHVVRAVLDAGVPALVYASSVGAYAPGPKNRRVDENWPATGIAGSTYSEDKAAVEALLDRVERDHPRLRIVRLRPGLIFQRDAGAQIARFFVGPLAPVALLRWQRIPVVPASGQLKVQAVHADDVADAYALAALGDLRGAVNIAAEPVLDPALVAREFGGRAVPVPATVLREAARLTWLARLQPTEPGWVTMGARAPLMDCSRARTELGWLPRHDAVEALRELVDGLAAGAGTSSRVLRPRDSAEVKADHLIHGRLPGHGDRY